MRTFHFAAALLAVTTVTAGDMTPSSAQSPAQYPYCALDASSGATSCYYSSRAQCGSRCIENPGYLGAQDSTVGARRRDAPRR
jgi:hypothetical protein